MLKIKSSTKRHMTEVGRKALAILLTFSMVSQTSPLAYAVGTAEGEQPTSEVVEPQATPDEAAGTTSGAGAAAVEEVAPAAEPEAQPEATPEAQPEATTDATSETQPDTTPGQQPEATTETTSGQQPGTTPVAELSPEVIVPDQVEAGDEVSLGLSFEHAYITILNQTVAAPANSIDIPSGADLRFAASADAGYKLAEVKLANGEAMQVLQPDGDGLYLISKDFAVPGTVLTVRSEATAAAQPVPEATSITAINDQTEFQYKDDDVIVTARLTDPTAVPAGVRFQVTHVTPESEKYDYDAYMQALNNSTNEEGKEYTTENTLLYDVAFLVPKTDDEGQPIENEWVEIQLEKGLVNLEFQFLKNQLGEGIEAEKPADVEINHLPLKDSVRGDVDTTADATNISPDDVIVEEPKKSDANVDAEQMAVTLESMSLVSVTSTIRNGKYEVTIKGDSNASFGDKQVYLLATTTLDYNTKYWVQGPIDSTKDTTYTVEAFYTAEDFVNKQNPLNYTSNNDVEFSLFSYQPYNEGNIYNIDRYGNGSSINGVDVTIGTEEGATTISLGAAKAPASEPTRSASAYSISVDMSDVDVTAFQSDDYYVLAKYYGKKIGADWNANYLYYEKLDTSSAGVKTYSTQAFYLWDQQPDETYAYANGIDNIDVAIVKLNNGSINWNGLDEWFKGNNNNYTRIVGDYAGYNVAVTADLEGASIKFGNSAPYMLTVDMSEATTSELTANYYVLASAERDGVTYYAYAPLSLADGTIEFAELQTVDGQQTIHYSSDLALSTRLVRSDNDSLTLAQAIALQGCTQYSNGQVVDGHIATLPAGTGSGTLKLAKKTLTATSHTADIIFYEANKTTEKASLTNPPISGSIVAVAKLTPAGTGSKGNAVAWAQTMVDAKQLNAHGRDTVSFNDTQFELVDGMGVETGGTTVFDPAYFDLFVTLYSADAPFDTYLSTTEGNRTIDGYRFISNQHTDGTKTKSEIKLAEQFQNSMQVQVNIEPASVVDAEGHFYAFVKVTHANSNPTYALAPVDINGEGQVTVDIYDWKNANGEDLNDEEFTGHEQSVQVWLVRSNNDNLTVPQAIANNNCVKYASGDMLGAYSVTYGQPTTTNSEGYEHYTHVYPINVKHTFLAQQDGLDYIDVLGNARYFGYVVNTWHLNGDAETNAAVKLVLNNGQQSGNDLTGYALGEDECQPWYIGEVGNGGTQYLKIKGHNSDVYTTQAMVDGGKIRYGDQIGDSRIVFHVDTQDEINAYIDRMMAHATEIGPILASRNSFNGDGSKLVPDSANKLTLDFTQCGPGTIYVPMDTVTSNGLTLLDIAGRDGCLTIKKNEDQLIVLNTAATNITLSQFNIINGPYEMNSGSVAGGQQPKYDNAASSIVWNMPNATTIQTSGSTTGIFLAPNASVSIYNTSSGWLVANEITNYGGEWHNIWQRYDQHYEKASVTVSARKLLDGKVPGDKRFWFVLTTVDGVEIERKQNADNGVITFDHKFAYNGEDFDGVINETYYINEVTEGLDGYEPVGSTTQVVHIRAEELASGKIKVTVKYGNGNSSQIPIFKNKTTQGDKGGLTVTKTVVSTANADKTRDYNFMVTLSDTSINGTYGGANGMTFTNGVATFTLKDGESKVANELPKGIGYTVTEESVEGLITTSTGETGTITGAMTTAAFTNTESTGGLKIRKTVSENGGTSSAEASSEAKSLLAGRYTFGIYTDAECTVPYKKNDQPVTVSLTIGDDGAWQTSDAINGMPAGNYWIKEEGTLPHGIAPVENKIPVTVVAGQSGDNAVIKQFTNNINTSNLSVTKTVEGALGDEANTKSFSFTVTLSDTAINGTFGGTNGMTFTDGVATFSLKSGETKTATGLPVDTTYTVTETADSNYASDKDQNTATGTITADGAAVTFVNTRKTGNLTINKTVVSDVAADANQVFTFTVQLTGTGANTINGTYSGIKFTNGKGTVEITGTGSKTIEGLPAGLGYTVTEAAVTNFTNTASNGTTGTIAADQTATASFTNTKNKGGLVVSKEVVSDAAADNSVEFSFTVTLDDKTISGTYGGMTFTNGEATFTLKNGESKSANGLPVGMGYKVTEASATGFTTSSTGAEGSITADAQAPATAIFTNTREKGSLKLSKTLISDRAADASQDFTFTITLGDTTITKTYGDVSFTNGVATVTLKGGESKTITDLPTGVTYTITEASATGFTQTGKTGDTGTISTTLSEATFTNTRETGELTISKTLVSEAAADADCEFNFQIELDDNTISNTYDGVTFSNGIATVSLKGGQSKTITGLPTAVGYTITETNSTGYNVTVTGQTGTAATGTITKTGTTAAFTNTRQTGKLEVTKTVVSDKTTDKQQGFSFTVTLGDTTIGGSQGKAYGGMTFKNGVATFTLKDGDSVEAENLPVGISYTVAEASADGFVTTYTGETGTISTTKSVAAFTNTRNTGDLQVTKTVVGATGADANKQFSFKVTLSDTTLGGAEGKQYGQMTFKNGVAEFTLSDGGVATATGLPKGLTYKVEETVDNDYVMTSSGAVEGTITEANTAPVAAFVNTRKTGSLKVSKTVVSDKAADKTQPFTIKVTLGDTTVNGNYDGVTFTNGVGSFTLADGGEKVITGLPANVSYEVEETGADGFTVTYTGKTGTIPADDQATATVKNERQTGTLELSKKLVSDAAADVNVEFTFTVTLGDTSINKAFDGVEFKDGVATVKLKGGQNKAISGLPTGVTYTVTEATVDGFAQTGSTNLSGSITTTKATAEITNTRDKGDLEVSKTVVSDAAADANQEFEFTVTLSDTSIGGANGKTYGGMTFKNGVATFNLKGGQHVTATGLPTGITYTVVETANGGFTTAKTGDTGSITTTKAVAAFTNTRTKGDLSVTKSVTSSTASDKTRDFSFTVTLSDTTIGGTEGKTYGDMTFTNGVATFTLKDGETKTATGLPTGITYTVEETTVDGFVKTASGETGTISTTASSAMFTNAKDEGGLSVHKTVESVASSDKQIEFEFTVTLDDTTVNGTYGDMSFTNGVATFKLKDGETKTASGLAKGIGYTVEETTNDLFTTTKFGDTGTVDEGTKIAEFTNTRKTGELEISKTVVSDAAADAQQVFTFNIELSDNTVAGTLSGVTFSAGKATVTLKGGESKTITGLPTGITYTVTETAVTGFTANKTSDTGTIGATKSNAAFTNTRETGSLELSKVLVSDATADANTEFTFTITLSDTTINKSYSGVQFASGVGTVKLKGGESKLIEGLPTGITYTITEAENTSFTTDVVGDRGTISTTKSSATFTNTRKKGNLEVTKTVVSNTTADQQLDFNFTVTLTEQMRDGKYGDMTFSGGVATFTLKHGQTAEATGLPVGIHYTVTEANAEGFTTTKTGETGEIVADTTETAAFTNTRTEGGLTVSKKLVSDLAADKDVKFTFTITLQGDAGRAINGTYSGVTFTNGVATVELKGGESKTIEGLPRNIRYEVTETLGENSPYTYTTKDTTGEIGEAASKAEITNTRKTGDLEVSKTVVSDAAADKNQIFTFTVELTDTTISKTFGGMTFENGVATVTLKGGEKATATGLPVGVGYTVTEASVTGFTADKAQESGTITAGVTSTAAFTNTRETGGLTVSKSVVSAAAADHTKDFSFTVKLGDTTINGTYGGMTFTNGEATFTLKDTQSLSATGLPTGISYTVTESTDNGFTTTKTGDTGIITTDGATAAFTNTRVKGGLSVTKTVESNTTADLSKQFSFTVRLDQDIENGTYGAMTFTDNVATFTLANGQTKAATDLPTGVGYTVEEATADGFVTTYSGVTSGTISTAGAEVGVKNDRTEGDLTVSKTVVSEATADHEKEFDFTVTLTDAQGNPAADIDGVYGAMSFTDGVATFKLKDGGSKTAGNLPAGLKYTVTEATADGFTTTKTGDTDTITEGNEPKVAAFTNTRETGSLTVSKKLVSDVTADKDKVFDITVTLQGAPINGTYGDMEFANGVATVHLKGGASATATGLPTGVAYTVNEADYSGDFNTVEVFNSGIISKDGATKTIVNTRKKGNIEISKTAVSDVKAEETQDYTFTVTLTDTGINETYSGVTFTDGVATVTVKGGEAKTIVGLPKGIGYTVTEATVANMTTGATGDNGTIGDGTTGTVAFTNTHDKGNLTVSKSVTSTTSADHGKYFNFTVTLKDAKGNVATDINKQYGNVTFENGVASFQLKDTEMVTATELPAGLTYVVEEETADGFITTYEGKTDTITKTGASAVVTNKRDEGELLVSKAVVSDIAADKDQEFNFTVTMKKADGTTNTEINGDYGDMAFNEGVATFKLKDNQSLSADGLPKGATYTVAEAGNELFTTKVNDVAAADGTYTSTIAANGNVAAFTNTRKKGDLEVSKTVVSQRAADKDQTFTFTVTLKDAEENVVTDINGTYGDMTFENGVATVTLKGGEKATATGLPQNISYTVSETPVAGFDTESTGAEGTITGTKATAAFTNTRQTGDLTVSKTVVSEATADAGQTFSFTVTLDDKTINGTYGGMTFENGVATFTLIGGASATATGLPTDVTYKVTEAANTLFDTTATNDEGTITPSVVTDGEGVETTVWPVASFTNTRKLGGLSVTKTVVSNTDADHSRDFTFTVTLDGAPVTGTYRDMTFEDGVATVTLADGETATATGLPVGVAFTVTEAEAEGFITTSGDNTGNVAAATVPEGGTAAVYPTVAFTNNRDEGGLIVSKSVISDRTADHTKEFKFTVTLNGNGSADIDGTYGDMTFADGVATFTLTDTHTAVATGLPTGLNYTVAEETYDGFTTAKTGDTGTIGEAASTAAFTNTRNVADLTVSKALVSDAQADANRDFTFTVTLDGAPITGTYGAMTFSKGTSTFTLKGGQSAKAEGLPTGIKYTVTETTDNGFTTKVNGTTGSSVTETLAANATVAFENTRKTGKLTISKEVVSEAAADADQIFTFTVTLSDDSINTTETKTYGDMVFENGVATVNLKGGQSATAENLPTDITYTVAETAANGFTTKVDEEDGTVADGTISTTPATVAFENTRVLGGLTVEKTVDSHTFADRQRTFDFTVTLYKGDPTGKTAEELEDMADTGINGTYGDLTFTNGVATLTLTDKRILDEETGKSTGIATATGLPTGLGYIVTETADSAFTTTSTGEMGVIAIATVPDDADEDAVAVYPTAAFTNARKEGGLAISKTVEHATAAGAEKVFSFVITLEGDEAGIVTGEYGPAVFINGVGAVTLSAAEAAAGTAKVVDGLPLGLTYTITETNMPGYIATSTGETGDVAATPAAVAFTNTYNLNEGEGDTTLTATKKLDGRPFTAGDEWVFTLEAAEGTPMPKDAEGKEVTSVTINPTEGTEATVNFGTISYTLDDLGDDGEATFEYTISETTGVDENGQPKVTDVINDTAKTVVISVADNGDGTLSIVQKVGEQEVTTENPITFTNKYKIELPLVATKHINGREWRTGENNYINEVYSFSLYDNDDVSEAKRGTSVANSAVTDGAGHMAKFGTFTFTTDDLGENGTASYSYTIMEDIPEDATLKDLKAIEIGEDGEQTETTVQKPFKDGVFYDNQSYDVTINLSKDENGTLVAAVEYARGDETNEALIFTNEYDATDTEATIYATKAMTGSATAPKAGAFEFELREANSNKSLLQTKKNGYVKADGVDTLSDDVSLVTFDTISYDAPGRYRYTINEVIPEDAVEQADGTFVKDGITYDATVHEVTVLVSDDLMGTLSSKVIYDGQSDNVSDEDAIKAAAFTNDYFGAQADISFGKYFYGNDEQAKFGFTLTAAEGADFTPRVAEAGQDATYQAASFGEDNPLVDRGKAFKLAFTNSEGFVEGKTQVKVPTITYYEPGTYRYIITENADDTVSSDAAELLVTVEVAKDATAKATSYAMRADGVVTPVTGDDVAFYNNGLVAMAFRARALAALDDMDREASFEPKVRKVLKQGFLTNGQFEFALYEGSEASGTPLLTGTNDANGTVAFGALNFHSEDAGKTFTYTIVEIPGTDSSINYSTDPITLTVNVRNGADGALVVEGTYEQKNEAGELVKTEDPTIINSYDTIVIHAVKRTREFNEDGTINNEAEGLAHAHYGLWMVNPNGEDVYMGLGRNQLEVEGSELESDANGNLYYDIPLLEGVAYYFLEEAPPPEGHLVDPYPTDYFTLVHDESGFRLVYEHDEFEEGKSFASYVPTYDGFSLN